MQWKLQRKELSVEKVHNICRPSLGSRGRHRYCCIINSLKIIECNLKSKLHIKCDHIKWTIVGNVRRKKKWNKPLLYLCVSFGKKNEYLFDESF